MILYNNIFLRLYLDNVSASSYYNDFKSFVISYHIR